MTDISTLIQDKTDHLVDLLSGKNAFDLQNLAAQAGQAIKNIDYSSASGQAIRNAAIGAGVGGVAGFTGASHGSRLGDTLQGAVAGGLMGGGGTMAYNAAMGRGVPSMHKKPSGTPMGSGDAAPAASASSAEGGGLLSAMGDRPVTTGAASLLAGDKAVRASIDNWGTGSHGSRSYNSPLRGRFLLPHSPGPTLDPTAAAVPKGWFGKLTDKLHGAVASNDKHDDIVGSRISARLQSWIDHYGETGNKNMLETLKYLQTQDGGRLGELAASSAELVDEPLSQKPLNQRDTARSDRFNTIAQDMVRIDDKGKAIPHSLKPTDYDKHLSSYARSSNMSRAKLLGMLGLGAIAEPTLWAAGSSLLSGDKNKLRLTPEQIQAFNEKWK